MEKKHLNLRFCFLKSAARPRAKVMKLEKDARINRRREEKRRNKKRIVLD
jgi:hypothetical protein